MNIREVLEYIRNLFAHSEFPRKRRAEEPLDYFSPTKSRKILRSALGYNMSNNEVIDLSDDDCSKAKKPTPIFKSASGGGFFSRTPTETITLDDDTDIVPIKRGNETRFQRMPARPLVGHAKYTSTPEDRPYQNGTSDDDDVILVQDVKQSAIATRGARNSHPSSLLGCNFSYMKPFTGTAYLKSLQQNLSGTSTSKENVGHRLADNITKRSAGKTSFGSLDYSIRLDDKMQYKKLLEKAASNDTNDTSIYLTPIGKLLNYDTANANLSRTEKIVAMTRGCNNKKKSAAQASHKLSTKDRIKRVLDNFDNEAVVVKDSDSESDVIFVSPPSPKPDIVVEPVNSLKKVVDLEKKTKSDWVDNVVAKHKRVIDERQKEIDELKQFAAKHEKINKDLRLDILADRVNKALLIKEQVLPIEEIEEEIELPALSQAQIKMVEKAFRGDPNEVLTQKYSLRITRRDLLTLAGLNWLNDEVINFYMNMIIERGKSSKWPKAYAFNTFFYVKLINSGPQSLRRWTKKIDIFSYDLICVPIHLGMHWCVAIIDFRDKSIRYYDSMGSDNDRCLVALKNYLEAEHLDKKNTHYNASDFILENVKDIPQQMNGSDCGMFACTFAEFLSRNAKISFNQEHMPYLRKKMVVEILEGELLIQ